MGEGEERDSWDNSSFFVSISQGFTAGSSTTTAAATEGTVGVGVEGKGGAEAEIDAQRLYRPILEA